MLFSANSQTVAQFVADITLRLKPDLRSITIMQLARSEVFFVRIVTDTSLEGIVEKAALNYSWLPIDISIAKRILG